MTTNATSAPVSIAAELAELVDQAIARVKAGDKVGLDELIRNHPDHADELQRLLPAVQVMADLSRSGEPGTSVTGDFSPLGELGDFRIIREVGRGGMGIVYEAEQISLSRSVALKVLPFAATMDPKQLQRFRNEAKAAASLHHEHVVPVYGVGCERGVHYYAMQFIDGTTLADVISELNQEKEVHHGATEDTEKKEKNLRSFSPCSPSPATAGTRRGKELFRRVAEVIAQAAEALEYAHSMGIVHRDVKPGNLMVDAAGKLWVADFGLARFGPDAGLTMTGDLLGTLRYMAPEQALAKHGLVDHRVDIYGLGCSLYELLTGRPAVDGEDRQEILRRIAFEEPASLRKLDKTIPAELETIALKCLAKESSERYATAGELADDLRRFVRDEPIQAQPPGPARRIAKWARRHVAAVWATAAVALVVGASIAALAGLAWHKNRQLAAAYNAEAGARHTAESGQRLARRALDELSSEVIDDWLSKQPKLSDTQKAFLRRVLAYYDELAVDGSVAKEARREVASALRRVGTIHYMLGQHMDADRAFRQSVGLFEKLVADFPDASSYRTELADSLNHLGAALHRNGRVVESIECARRMIALREQADDAASPDGRRGLVKAHSNLGRSLRKLDRADVAIASNRKALAVLKQLAEDFPDDPAVQTWRAAILCDLGHCHADKHENGEAERCYRDAVAILKTVTEKHPAEAEYVTALADAYSALGVILARLGRPEDMEAAIRQGLALLKQRTVDFPGVPSYRLSQAIGYYHFALVLKPLGRLEEREKALLKAIELAEPLWAANRQIVKCRDLLCDAHNNLAVLYVRTGRFNEAATSYEGALSLLAEGTAEPGTGSVDLLRKARLYDSLGCTLHDLGRLDDARRSFGKSIAVLSRLTVETPDNADCHSSLAFILADCPDASLRDPARAVREAMKAVELEPAKGDHWSDLGVARYRAGDPAGSVAALHKALERRPGEASDWFFLAMAHTKFGQKDEARRQYEKALAWMAKHEPPDPELRRYRAEAVELLGIKTEPKGAPPVPPKE